MNKSELEKLERKVERYEKKKKKSNTVVNLLISIICLIITVVLASVSLEKGLDFSEAEVIHYTEKSNIDYKVNLKKNDFFDEEYLENSKDKVYVTGLIDNIKIDFDYLFDINEDVDIDFDVDVMGKLIINDENGKEYYSHDYELYNGKVEKLKNSNYKFDKDIVVDYGYYNNLANKFKSNFGLSTNSKLVVYAVVDKTSNNSTIKLKPTDNMSVTIPLSEKSIDITLDYKNINDSTDIIRDKIVFVDNVALLVVSVILYVISVLILVHVLTLITSKNNSYEKRLNNILLTYNRFIVNTETGPDTENSKIIKISSFEELLDLRDNLKLPILYYEVSKNLKSYFYICHNEELYLYIMKNNEE